MSPSDLRIGNFLQDSLTGELMIVVELTEKNITADIIDRDKFPLPDGWKMEPIPLTRDIFIRFGAETWGDENEYCKFPDQAYPFDYLDQGTGFQVFDDNGVKVVFLEFVHELQNFYRSIDKEGLHIKRPYSRLI